MPGEKYEPHWNPTELNSPSDYGSVFTLDEDAQLNLKLEYIQILGAGADSSYSLSIERQSIPPFKKLTILDGVGNGVQVSGEWTYIFENLSIQSNMTSSDHGINVHSKANVSIDDLVSILNELYFNAYMT